MQTDMERKQLNVEVSKEVWDALHEEWRKRGAQRGGKRDIVEEALRQFLKLAEQKPKEKGG